MIINRLLLIEVLFFMFSHNKEIKEGVKDIRNDRNGPIGAAAKCSRNAQDRMDPLRSSGAPRAAVPERVRWFQICYIVSICYSHPLVFQSNHLFQSDHTAT